MFFAIVEKSTTGFVINPAGRQGISDYPLFCILYVNDTVESPPPIFTTKNKYVQGINKM
jgi:hypothetical protein